MLNNSLYYYKTSTNQEIDFLMQDQHRNITLIQICQTLVNLATRQSEISVLLILMKELGLLNAIIVTRNETDKIEVPWNC